MHLRLPAFTLAGHLSNTAAAKSLQSCTTLCDPIDGSPPGSPVPGILQARTLAWVAISFSSAWKWKWSCSVVSDSQWPHGLQPTSLLHPWDFPSKSTGVGCHCLLPLSNTRNSNSVTKIICIFTGRSDQCRDVNLKSDKRITNHLEYIGFAVCSIL